ncbi:MAG: flagellar assembly protein H [Pseudanabaena sp.]|nr:MAG: flagellar assembly protein H [Pseudanabaena sp.]
MSSYDNTCKFLAETFPSDFASWLLGKPIALTKLEPSELSAEPIRADSVIFLESPEIIMHLEFQTRTDETMAYRMANYWLRLYGKYSNREIHQTVIYLKPTKSPLVYETKFSSQKLNHEFNVIRLWEEPTEVFQEYLGLLPLSVLSKTINPTETLRQTAQLIDKIEDSQVKNNVSAATAIISGLALDKLIIQQLLKSDVMRESVIYQDILAEGLAKGIAEGKAKGIAEEKNQIAMNMLRSNMNVDLIVQITGLSIKQIEKLRKLIASNTKKPKTSTTN